MARMPALLLVLGALLLSPAAAGAAAPGVNLSGPPTTDAAQRVIASGAKTVRVFALWRDFEPDGPGQYPPTASSPQYLRGLSAAWEAGLRMLSDHGIKTLFVLYETPGWANGSGDALAPPSDPATYAAFAGRFAAHMKQLGVQVRGYEIWNEADAPEFWHPAPDAARYAALLKAAYRSIKAADPSATVIASPTTANNVDWMRRLYDAGAGGSFDAAAVHTDTACLDRAPDDYDRMPDGTIAPYVFLGYRAFHDVMAANGDGDKPIIMSELGWTSTGGRPNSCARGRWAGQKADGVTEAKQADYLSRAFGCMANDSYLSDALWFTLDDMPYQQLAEMRSYGLVRANGTFKPAYAAFQQIAARNGGPAKECGDFDPPKLTVLSPQPGQQFVDSIDIIARATDSHNQVVKIKYTYDGGKNIRSYDASAADMSKPSRLAPWWGSKALALGEHTIEVTAYDKRGNATTVKVPVVKVATMSASLVPRFAKGVLRPKCRRRVCTLSGRLQRGQAGTPTIGGKVAVQWQFLNRKKKWRKLSGGLANAGKPFRFRAKLKLAGRWRVRVVYQGLGPWKPAATRYAYFRLR